MKKLVLVDSCIHIKARKAGDQSLNVLFTPHPEYEFATCGMVELEVMRGIKGAKALADAQHQFALLRYLPTTRATWALARKIAQDLDLRGVPIKPQDMIIAACAFEAGAAVLTHDKHFWEIAALEALDRLEKLSSPWRAPRNQTQPRS